MQSRRRTNRWQSTKGVAPLLLVAGFLLASAGAIQGQTPAASVANLAPCAEAKENADRQAKDWIARGTPGLALAVAVDGKIVYSEGFGFADLEARAPVWPATKFRIGSISKPLTAVGLMALVQSGKLDLDAPIQKYVPSFPKKGSVITVKMVAGHLGGIRHYQGDEFAIQKHYANSYKWAGGGFLSTAEDLVRFGSALLQPGILNAQSLKTMFTAQKTSAGEETGYGIGWGIVKTPSGKQIYAHAGGSVGGTSQLIVYPDSHVVVALVTNLFGGTWKTEEVQAVAEAFGAIKK
jgi:CubicO group peptidase (beta-lactamase class C family)